MRWILALIGAYSCSALADGLVSTRGAVVLAFNGNSCVRDTSKSIVFNSGSFPFTKLYSRIESVTDASESDFEIRLRLTGWVKEMTDYRNADLVIKGPPEQLNKFRFDSNIGDRIIRVTKDPRCMRMAALVDSIGYEYAW